jgi:hypothetical protein
VQRVEKIFRSMNKDKDAKITYPEFVECSKQDPTVMDVRFVPRLSFPSLYSFIHRHSRSTTVLYNLVRRHFMPLVASSAPRHTPILKYILHPHFGRLVLALYSAYTSL